VAPNTLLTLAVIAITLATAVYLIVDLLVAMIKLRQRGWPEE